MGKIMEAIFCVFYMVFTLIMGYKIVSTSKHNKNRLWYLT